MILTEETKKDYTGTGIITEEKEDGERKYIGDYIDGKEHGIGMYQSRGGGHKYAGQLNEDRVEGIGIKIWDYTEPTEIFCGEYKNDERNGIGYWKLPTGAMFIGEHKNHIIAGFGMMITWDQLKFIGYVSIWSAIKGTWYDQEDNEIDITKLGYEYSGNKYKGDWKNGKKNGQGTITYPDGTKYVGEFKEDSFHGQGTITYPDGIKYVGEWKNGNREGQGTWTHPDGTKYVGEFKDEKMNGQGTYILPDGKEYVGEFKDGKKHGRGIETRPNGDKYVGEWTNGKFIG